MSDIDLEELKRLVEEKGLGACVAAKKALPALIAEVERLRARLECDHVWRLKDGKMTREEMHLPEHLDGISCRDETIKELERQLKERAP